VFSENWKYEKVPKIVSDFGKFPGAAARTTGQLWKAFNTAKLI